MSLNFVKVGFHDKVTGLCAFEEQIPYQKYQGPTIVVRLQIATFTDLHILFSWQMRPVNRSKFLSDFQV